MTEQLTLATDHPPLQPGDWTPTGWGARHRVRRSGEKWTELACHTLIRPHDPDGPRRVGESQRCETARIRRDADEDQRCSRCAALPDLGPIRYGPIGEVRRSSDGLIALACQDVGHPSLSGGTRWKLIGPDPVPQGYGWRSEWDVADWDVLGNVFDLEAS